MIHIQNLTKRYGKITAVDNLSLRVLKGEVLALLGPNGSGKSTTLKALVGLVRPSGGSLEIGGYDICKEPQKAKELLSYLPQRASFPGQLSVEEVVRFYASLRGVASERVQAVLEQMRFNGLSGRTVSELSGGMRQRLGLAVAYLPDAPVLVLDEPTASLDPEGGIDFHDFISHVKSEGKTILFSTHVMSDVEHLADRVAILVDGKRVALESADSLRRSCIAQTTFRIVLAHPDRVFVHVASEAGATEVILQRNVLLMKAAAGTRVGILRTLEAAGAEIEEFSTQPASLEEIYLRYMHGDPANGQGLHGAAADLRKLPLEWFC